MSLPAAAERAALAIGRLDAVLDGHPLRLAWEHRMRLAAAVQASAWDGRGVDGQRLAGVVAGVPYKPQADMQAEHRALMFLDYLARRGGGVDIYQDDSWPEDADPHDDDLQLVVEAVDASKAQSALLAIAEVVWTMRVERDTAPGILHAAIPAILAKRKLTRSGFVVGLAAFPGYREHGEWMEAFLDGMARAADDGLARLHGLGLTYEQWRQRVGQRQKNSRLPQVVAMALCHPYLSPVSVRGLLGTKMVDGKRKPAISLPGASKLLDELTALGVLVEGTDRKGSHRLFLAADLGVGTVSRTVRPHPRELARKFSGQHLDELLDGVDAAMRRATALLAKHGIIPAAPEPEDDADLGEPDDDAWGS